MKEAAEKVGIGEKFAYSLGDFASNLIFALACSLITYFYTNTVGISAAAAGAILLFSQIFDGITDVLIGFLIDRTRSKYGKARPWLLWMAVPFGICCVLLVCVPRNASMLVKIIYAFITYNLVMTVCYTAINVPYGALNTLMTRDQYQRSVINIWRMTMAMLATMVITSVTLPIINGLGGDQAAWIKTMTVYASLAVAMFLICFKCTRERVTEELGQQEKVPVKTALKAVMKNKYWLMLIGVWLLYAVNTTFSGTTTVYYAQYILGDETLMGPINIALNLPCVIGIPLMAPLIKKFGKKVLAVAGCVITLIGCFMMLIQPDSLTMIVISTTVKGIGTVPFWAVLYAMMADTVEYGEWKTGVRTEGLLYSASTFGAKAGAGIGSAIVGAILSANLFDGMQAVQPDSAISAISGMYLFVPIAAAVLQILCLAFYKLDKEYPKIMEELRIREAKGRELKGSTEL
ncbi:MFS transporter [Mediterraneibacter agrestimuris]|uniref:MFS transporter n=1 Tax=Mediterraneibacter agrestimuris TaxID=2941333 RepID=UPI00203FEA05|nr:MFS transporter [Mediterraneibacter agrestimuris]